MKKCGMCGAGNQDTAEICTGCGAWLPKQPVGVPFRKLRVRSAGEIAEWLSAARAQLSAGAIPVLEILNFFVSPGEISLQQFRTALNSGTPLPHTAGLTNEAKAEITQVPYAWFQEGDAAAARPVFTALNMIAADAYLENMIGACSHLLEEQEEALSHFGRALRIQPDHSHARLNHATELACLFRNVECLLELAQLTRADGSKEVRDTARRAREELDTRWALILDLARNRDDPDQRAGALQIYNEVWLKAKEMGVTLPEICASAAERLRAAREVIENLKRLGLPVPEQMVKGIEARALQCTGCGRPLAEGEECEACAKKNPPKTAEEWLHRLSVFVSYRRQDAGPHVLPLIGALRQKFECEYFIDQGGIESGEDYMRKLQDKISGSEVFLELIGPNWLTSRLDDPSDILRREIEWAMAEEKKIVPVLIGGACMPEERDLPAPLRPLARIQALTIRVSDFEEDIQKLSEIIRGGAQTRIRNHGGAVSAGGRSQGHA